MAYMWNLKKWYKCVYLQNTIRLTDIQNKLMVTKGEGGINWQFGISRYKLLYTKWASLVIQIVKNPPAMWETWVQSLHWEDPLEKGKATPEFWPGESHGLYSPWGHKESDTTE